MSEDFHCSNLDIMTTNSRLKYGWRSQSLVTWIRFALVGLGLFLLTMMLGLVAHNTSAIGHQNTLQVSLMTCEKRTDKLIEDSDALRDELDRLRANSSRLMKDLEALQSQYNAAAASRDQLQLEVDRLNESITGKVCRSGWIEFNSKYYYASENGQTKTWESSRRDCVARGGDLVIITTAVELSFVTNIHYKTWIGLSDTQQEGRWKWVDGSDLVRGFWNSGEPNNAGNEDCAEISGRDGKWNDVPCNIELPWICEKVLGVDPIDLS